MIFFLSLMSSRLESRHLKELVPEYAAKYTDEDWDYMYTENLQEAHERLLSVRKHDVVSWDTTVKDAGEELVALRKRCPTAFLLIFATPRTNPMLYVRAGVAPDALVIKPFEDPDLRRVLDESFTMIGERFSKTRDQMITVFSGNAQKYLQVDMIDYLEARDKKVYICIKKMEYGLYDSMEEILSKLPKNFVRCHRSYAVNMRNVDKIVLVESYLIMKGGARVPVSRSYKKEIKDYGINAK